MLTISGHSKIGVTGVTSVGGGVYSSSSGFSTTTMTTQFYIPKSILPPVLPSESYIKFEILDKEIYKDYGVKTEDIVGRFDYSTKIIGTSGWDSSTQYFSTFSFRMSSLFGGEHPESDIMYDGK